MGTFIDAIFCGYFILKMGTQYIVFGGIMLLLFSVVLIMLRIWRPKLSELVLK